jgi:hypothetical protein
MKRPTMTASELGRALNALRKTHGGGRPKKLRKCPYCKLKFGAREMRVHKCEVASHA